MIDKVAELVDALVRSGDLASMHSGQGSQGIVIRPCSIDDVLSPTNAALIQEYAEESKISGMPPINPDYQTYKSFETSGCQKIFGAFHDDRLVGLIILLFTKLPHYSAMTAITESFFVLKQYRKGGTGKRLLNTAVEYADSVGAVGILVSAPAGGVLERVMPRSGFVKSNSIFFKRLADE